MEAPSSPALAAYRRHAAAPVAIATLLIIPAVLLDGSATPSLARLAAALNWATWLVLAGHVAALLWLAGLRAGWRLAWFDAVLVIVTMPVLPASVQAARALRLLRIFRLGVVLLVALHHLRDVLQHRQFHVVALSATLAVLLGAAGIFFVEHGANPNIGSPGDALWWAIVTVTTVGYGDISPVTTEGRVIAVGLMVLGIGSIGAFTATVASFFVSQDEGPDFKAMEASLVRLEAKLDAILEERRGAGDERPGRDLPGGRDPR